MWRAVYDKAHFMREMTPGVKWTLRLLVGLAVAIGLAMAIAVYWVVSVERSFPWNDPAAKLSEAAKLDETVIKLHESGKSSDIIRLSRQAPADATQEDTIAALSGLARRYENLGDYTNLEPTHKRLLAIQEKALGSNHAMSRHRWGNWDLSM
jgi:hypothetical protein